MVENGNQTTSRSFIKLIGSFSKMTVEYINFKKDEQKYILICIIMNSFQSTISLLYLVLQTVDITLRECDQYKR